MQEQNLQDIFPQILDVLKIWKLPYHLFSPVS